jgi:hypothetical protein
MQILGGYSKDELEAIREEANREAQVKGNKK